MKWRSTTARIARFALPAALAFACGGGCLNAPPPAGPAVDLALAQDSSAARLALARGDDRQAALLYGRALQRAREMDDAGAIGRAAYNLAAALVRDGRYAAAADALREAEMETVRAGANAADVLLLEAKVARWREAPREALAFGERVLVDPASRPADSHRVQVHVLRGELALDRGAADVARVELGAAERLLGPSPGAAVRAGVVGLGARLRAATDDPAGAARGFDEAAELLRQVGLYRDMARALARAGDAYRRANQLAAAIDRLFRAGRSFAAAGDAAEAGRLLDEAAQIATQVHDAQHLSLIRTLRAGGEATATTTRPTTDPE